MTVRQVSGPDAAFLYGERPEWHFHVSSLIVMNPSTAPTPFTHQRCLDHLAARLHRAPQFRWKLLEGPLRLRLDRPIWIDDPDFDITRHVHRVAVCAPGDDRALGELVGRLSSYKLDRSRPLWEMWVIEGLADGRVALLVKVHHAIIDGASGSELATLLFDLDPNEEPGEEPPWEPAPQPPMFERLAVATANSLFWPYRAHRFSRQIGRQSVIMARAAMAGAPPTQPLQAPRTPLNGALTSDRAFASAQLDLDAAMAVKNAFGVKLNDVVLAISSGALRNYLLELGEVPDRALVAQVPVSIRGDSNSGHVGTKVAAMFCTLATHLDDPAARIRAIHASSTSGKAQRTKLTDQTEVNLTETTPPAAIAIASRLWSLARLDGRVPPIFNLVISNVAGPPFDLYVAGAHIEAMYPMGPLLYGSGVNFTVVSSKDRLDFGLLSCPALVRDPWAIADRLAPALGELQAAAGLG